VRTEEPLENNDTMKDKDPLENGELKNKDFENADPLKSLN